MEGLVAGDVVSVPFPFTDQTAIKLRPALILAGWRFSATNEYLLAMISSRPPSDVPGIELESSDYIHGGLPRDSFVRPWYIATLNESRIVKKLGTVSGRKLGQVLAAVRDRFS